MYYIGDVHGKIKEYRSILRSLPAGASSIQLGDMGIGFKGVYLHAGGCMHEGHRFIRGNHDSPERCRKHPRYLGEYGYLPEERLFYLGGAWSIDADWRIEGVSWWRDEELSWQNLGDALDVYVQTKPEIVVTHDAPTKVSMRMLECTDVKPHHTPCPTDQSVRMKGEEYRRYKEHLGGKQTRTGQALQWMFENWQPKYWLFGHWHNTLCFNLAGTEFQCLGELAVREINLDANP